MAKGIKTSNDNFTSIINFLLVCDVSVDTAEAAAKRAMNDLTGAFSGGPAGYLTAGKTKKDGEVVITAGKVQAETRDGAAVCLLRCGEHFAESPFRIDKAIVPMDCLVYVENAPKWLTEYKARKEAAKAAKEAVEA